MRMEDFIRKHRDEIDRVIIAAVRFTPRQASCQCPRNGTDHYCGDTPSLNNEDRRKWILNDEGLYNWARSEGVSG